MAPDPSSGRRRPASWWLWAAYWVLLFGATHVPVPGAGRPLLPHLDKLVHAVIYFLLTWLGGRHLLARG
ncbi:MAG: hypothetical protein ACE5EX_09565, partial [Phycisphaerae bacterium]